MPSIVRLERNTRGRDILVGDVHGHFSKLADALTAIGFDPRAGDRLICCGDLVDRGEESAVVLQWLARPWFHVVRGNHEDLTVWAYEDGTGEATAKHVMNGGQWFLQLPEASRREVWRAFQRLPLAIEVETAGGVVVVVHADMPAPTWAECRAMIESTAPMQVERAELICLWGRGRIEGETDWGPVPDVRAVIHGHTPVERHTTLENCHYIDGGAWLPAHRGPRPFILLDAATLEAAKPASAPTLIWS